MLRIGYFTCACSGVSSHQFRRSEGVKVSTHFGSAKRIRHWVANRNRQCKTMVGLTTGFPGNRAWNNNTSQVWKSVDASSKKKKKKRPGHFLTPFTSKTTYFKAILSHIHTFIHNCSVATASTHSHCHHWPHLACQQFTGAINQVNWAELLQSTINTVNVFCAWRTLLDNWALVASLSFLLRVTFSRFPPPLQSHSLLLPSSVLTT